MPIIKNNKKNKIIYFIHIPKCAGSSVEDFFIENNLIISFLDRTGKFQNTWYRSSPQHIDAATFKTLFKIDFFDEIFTVIRNPVNRYISAYKHTYKFLKPNTNINDFTSFLAEYLSKGNSLIGFRDNHFVPMNNFIPDSEKIKVFRLEENFDLLTDWLNEINFLDSDLKNRKVPFKNGSKFMDCKLLELNKYTKDFIKKLYAEDFSRYGYENL